MTMEDKLASMTQKMIDLQMKYLDLQENSNDEINKLHHKIHELSANKVHKVHPSHKGKSAHFTKKKEIIFNIFSFFFQNVLKILWNLNKKPSSKFKNEIISKFRLQLLLSLQRPKVTFHSVEILLSLVKTFVKIAYNVYVFTMYLVLNSLISRIFAN